MFPESLTLISWNINSVRFRLGRVRAFVERHVPDLICLQEIRCRSSEFPASAFEQMGYSHLLVRGQKGSHGVAIVSRHPFEEKEAPILCRHGHARSAAVSVYGLHVHNLYVPAGGYVADAELSEKFAHKLDFLERMRDYYGSWRAGSGLLLAGDLNVAPHERDVWSHRQMRGVVSHTPLEREGLARVIEAGGFCDIGREVTPDEQRLYTWWSYRARDWRASDRGRRLDHIWANERGLERVDMGSYEIYREERGGEKPSDHVPVGVSFRLR